MDTTSQPVSLLKRLGVMAYDLLLVFTTLIFAGALVFIVFGGDTFVNKQGESSYPWWYFYYLLAVIAWFYIGFWHKGETLGLRAWKLKVVKLDGSRLDWTTASIRFIASLLCLATFGLGFLWSLVDKDKRALNDILSHTKLIYRDN